MKDLIKWVTPVRKGHPRENRLNLKNKSLKKWVKLDQYNRLNMSHTNKVGLTWLKATLKKGHAWQMNDSGKNRVELKIIGSN